MAGKSPAEAAENQLLAGDPGLAAFGGHPGPVQAVAVTPDGTQVVTVNTSRSAGPPRQKTSSALPS